MTQIQHTHTQAHTRTHSHTRTHAHTHTRTHTHTHAHTHTQLVRASEGIADESGVWLAWLCGGESARSCETECKIPYTSATPRHSVMQEQVWESVQSSRGEERRAIEGERDNKWKCMLIERVLAFRAGVSIKVDPPLHCVCVAVASTRGVTREGVLKDTLIIHICTVERVW